MSLRDAREALETIVGGAAHAALLLSAEEAVERILPKEEKSDD